jgi:hypothetical protein
MSHLTTAERIGRREGQVVEAQTSILEILEARIGDIPPDLASRLTQINDLDRLHRLRKMLINGAPLSDFEKSLDNTNTA